MRKAKASSTVGRRCVGSGAAGQGSGNGAKNAAASTSAAEAKLCVTDSGCADSSSAGVFMASSSGDGMSHPAAARRAPERPKVRRCDFRKLGVSTESVVVARHLRTHGLGPRQVFHV